MRSAITLATTALVYSASATTHAPTAMLALQWFSTGPAGLVVFIIAVCLLVALSLGVYAFVLFRHRDRQRGFAHLAWGCLFLLPLYGLRNDGFDVVNMFGIVLAIAFPIWIYKLARQSVAAKSIAVLVAVGMFAALYKAGWNLRDGHYVPMQVACVANLKELEGAKEKFASEKKLRPGVECEASDLLPFLRHHKLNGCPGGGSYTIGRIGEAPSCSLLDHTQAAMESGRARRARSGVLAAALFIGLVIVPFLPSHWLERAKRF